MPVEMETARAHGKADPAAAASPDAQTSPLELSIVLPCLNEAETVGICVRKAVEFLRSHHVSGEVVVADNGSTDGSEEISRSMGARVVQVSSRGYGNALMGGIAAARGRFVIMGDADDSYDFSALMPFVERLRDGYELVMGNRFAGGVSPGAMPPLHRYLGNPVLTGIGRLFFRSPVRDFHCGLRGFTREAFQRMDLQTTGMEFASEMVVKATMLGMRVTEVPTTLSPDGRSRPPHLRSWRDGWRHLRFMLLYSPKWLFFYPGIGLIIAGMVLGTLLLRGPRTVGGIGLDVTSLLFAAGAVLVGYKALLFAVMAHFYAVRAGLLPTRLRIVAQMQKLPLELGIGVGALITLVGFLGAVFAVAQWGVQEFGQLEASQILRIAIPSVAAMIIGVETIFASFYLSVLALEKRKSQ